MLGSPFVEAAILTGELAVEPLARVAVSNGVEVESVSMEPIEIADSGSVATLLDAPEVIEVPPCVLPEPSTHGPKAADEAVLHKEVVDEAIPPKGAIDEAIPPEEAIG
ncbi:hypothetical protein Nepgr_032668 [Nepenthes gracilis]|uniref:Uncharacterized protein n=1 Tax=Nepenthes gracilis TaxID=150966 RepID=A0AAD3Y7V0_NEPGR|nr:hypothetical protein Nepgr_032668 [Nepenthes gracilis]